MLVSVVLLCVTILGTWFSVVPVADASPRIIGEKGVDIKDFPYQISLEYANGHSCGGSILSPIKILTSAHCTKNRPASKLRVRAGSSLRETGGQVVSVAKKVEHPELNSPTFFNNDIAILILSEPLVLNDYVQTIEVSEVEDVPVDVYSSVTGWGGDETGEIANHLQTLDLVRSTDNLCRAIFGTLYNSTTSICFDVKPGSNTCSIVSGVPVVFDGKQVGLLSYGFGDCSKDYPQVYTKLAFYRDFINSVN